MFGIYYDIPVCSTVLHAIELYYSMCLVYYSSVLVCDMTYQFGIQDDTLQSYILVCGFWYTLRHTGLVQSMTYYRAIHKNVFCYMVYQLYGIPLIWYTSLVYGMAY